MKICPKCKKQYENGNFCTDCENDDGSPVRLEEDKISCPKCKRTYEKGTKFCSECGVRLGKGGQPSVEGMSIGDKNVIAGDVNMIGKKETYKVGGNATIVHNEDETKQTAKCHICGSVVKKTSGYICPDCGQFTCAECFDDSWKRCVECARKVASGRAKQYRAKVDECLANGNKITTDQLKKLRKFAEELEFDEYTAMVIEDEAKRDARSKAPLTTIEKVDLEKATSLFYDDWNTAEALKLVEPIYWDHRSDDSIVELFIQLMTEENPEGAKSIIDDLEADLQWAYLSAATMDIRDGNMPDAERRLTAAEKMWNDSELVKSHMAIYWLAVHKRLNEGKWLKEAENAIKKFKNTTNKLELTWQVKAQMMLQEAKTGKHLDIERSFCKNKNLYYGLMTRDFFTSKENLYEKLRESANIVWVDGGDMTLGDDNQNDNPKHTVSLDAFLIGKYPVTQKLWKSVMDNNPSEYKGDNRPVETVSWYDAVEFCNKLSEAHGLTPCYDIDKSHKDPNNEVEDDDLKWTVKCNFKANGYRLPTEAEWEYAARGGQESRGYRYAGSDNLDDVAWCGGNSDDKTHNVGEKDSNELGLYDMSGNVYEWCWDWYDRNIGHCMNPTGASRGSYRVRRGGSFNYYDVSCCAVVYRNVSGPYDSNDGYNGFRLVRSSS